MTKDTKIELQPENVQEQEKTTTPLLKRWWIRLLLFVILVGFVLQSFFYFLATPFLKEFLQNKINKDTDGLYELYFEHLTLDFTGNNIFLTGLHIKPNKDKYKELLQQHKITKPLYEIEITALLIYDINIYESFTKPGISIEHIDILQPHIKIVDAPDKKTIKKENKRTINYDVFHQDLYPAISSYVTALNVENINFTDGKFDLALIENKSSISQAEKISINLNNFAIDSLSAHKFDRLFYSEKIDLKIDNYSLYLKKMNHTLSIDSIRIITNKEIAIYNTKLRPDTLNMSENDTLKSIIRSDIPLFKLIKPNISDIYFKKSINIEKVIIQSPKFSIVELVKTKKQKKNTININPYIFIEDYFKFIKIKEFILQEANTKITFAGNFSPNIDIPNYRMNFTNFNLDSNSFNRKDNFFYCSQFEFNGNNIDVRLNKSKYQLEMSNLLLSTFQKKFTVSNFKLSHNEIETDKLNSSIFSVSFPFMSASGFDIKKLYNKKELQLSTLNLKNASIKIDKYSTDSIQYRTKKNSAKKKEILKYIIANNINLSNADISYNTFINNKLQNELQFTVTTNISNLKHFPYKKDTILTTEFLNFSSFKTRITSLQFKSKEANYEASVRYFSINSKDSSLRIRNFNLKFDTLNSALNKLVEVKKNNFINLKLPHVSLNKFNIKDLIFNKKLIFESSKIISPKLFYLSFNHLKFNNIKSSKSIFSFEPEQKNSNKYQAKLAKIQNYFSLNKYEIQKFKNLNNYFIYSFIYSLKKAPYINPKQGLFAKVKIAEYDSTELFKLIEKLPFLNNLKKHFNLIKFNKLDLIKASVQILKKDSNYSNVLFFKNKTSLVVNKFQLKPDSIIQNFENFFADSIKLVFDQQTIEVANSMYKLTAGKLGVSVPENAIFGSNIYIYEKEGVINELKTDKFLNFIIPEFKITGFSTENFNRHKRIEFDKIHFKKPIISQITRLDFLKKDSTVIKVDSVKIADLLKLKLPKGISAVTFTDLQIDSAKLLSYNEKQRNRKIIFKSTLSLNMSDFILDPLISDTIPNYNYLSNLSFDISDIEKSLADSIHTFRAERIRFSMDTTDITIKNIRLTADSTKANYDSLQKYKTAQFLNIKIPSIDINNINLHKFYYQNELEIDSIQVQTTDLDILRFPLVSKTLNKKKLNINSLDLYKKITPKLNSFKLNDFTVNEVNFFSKNNNLTDTVAIKKAFISIKNINIDSTSTDSTQLFYNENISIKIPEFHYSLNQFYKIKFDSLCVSSSKQKAQINGFVIKPRLSRAEFGRLKHFQTGMSDFAVSEIQLNKFNFAKLIQNKIIEIESIDIGGSRLHVYKDLKLPVDSTRRPPMPLILLYKAADKVKINIKEVNLSNLTLKYEENVDTANADSRILVENMNASIQNITNLTELENEDTTTLSVNGKIMSLGFFNVDFTFPLRANLNQYTFNGYVESFPITSLNNYFTNSHSVRIPYGKLDKMKFNIIANDNYAYGKLKFIYHGLKIEMFSMKKGTENKRGVINVIANGLIKSSNPRYPGTPPRMGQVYFKPNPEKQVFNYWILSILSGIKSTIGINSKEGKKVLREKRSILQKLNFVDEIQDRISK